MQPLPVPTSTMRGPRDTADRVERRLDHELRLRPRDEHVGRDAEDMPPERLLAGQVLEGDARGARVDEALERGAVRVGQIVTHRRMSAAASHPRTCRSRCSASSRASATAGRGEPQRRSFERVRDPHARIYADALSFSAW